MLPRVQPADARRARRTGSDDAQQAARLNHPNLAHVVEIGVQDHWPYVAYDRATARTLGDAHRPADGLPARRCRRADLPGARRAWPSRTKPASRTTTCSPTCCCVSRQRPRAAGGLEVAPAACGDLAPADRPTTARCRPSPSAARLQRDAAERDVLALGVLLHQACWPAQPALDEPDIGRVIARLPPHGPRDRAPAVDHAARRCPRRCAPSPTAPPTARSASATATRARCCARSKAGCEAEAEPTAARWRCCSTACARVGVLPACPARPRAWRGWR